MSDLQKVVEGTFDQVKKHIRLPGEADFMSALRIKDQWNEVGVLAEF
jgi:hypothetical protein